MTYLSENFNASV